MEIKENNEVKILRSKDYNYNFNKKTGYFERWGATLEQDPQRSFFGPEIADIEITTICHGPAGKLCSFCYKSNNQNGHNMSFEEFKTIFHKIPKTLTQIAFGADAGGFTNPDLFKMMEYCRNNNYNTVVPNITVADISDEVADKLAELAGAVAVSFYKHAGKEVCYNSIKKLTDRGMKQVNIHFPLMKTTAVAIDELIEDTKTDPRLAGLNAIVFLSLKQKGRGETFERLTYHEFQLLVEKCLDKQVPFGFDSCSSAKFMKAIRGKKNEEEMLQCTDPCESTSFSLYISEMGKVYPCSFMEGTKNFWEKEDGYDMINDIKDSTDFLKRVWNGDRFLEFGIEASKCVSCGNGCQYYNV